MLTGGPLYLRTISTRKELLEVSSLKVGSNISCEKRFDLDLRVKILKKIYIAFCK